MHQICEQIGHMHLYGAFIGATVKNRRDVGELHT